MCLSKLYFCWQCNMSMECMSHILLHPDLTAGVKVDLLNTDLNLCPSCDLHPDVEGRNTTLKHSDRWRHGIQVLY